MAQLWEVTGRPTGRLPVTVGRSADSTRLLEFLRAGAVLEERELARDRLRFRKVHGDGPLSGWVNIGLDDSSGLEVRCITQAVAAQAVATQARATQAVASQDHHSAPSRAPPQARVEQPPAAGQNETRESRLSRFAPHRVFDTLRRLVGPRQPATLAQWYDEEDADAPIVARGVTRIKWTRNDGESWEDTEEAWVIREQTTQPQVWDLNEMDLVSGADYDDPLASANRGELQASAPCVCARCSGCVRPPGHSGPCQDADGRDMKIRRVAPRVGVYVGLAKDLTCPGDDVTFEFTLRGNGIVTISCAPKLSLFAGGQPPWSCTGVWGFEDDNLTVCITQADFKGPKDDDELLLPVSMDGASFTFKGTACRWQGPPPLPADLDLSGWWTLTPDEMGADPVLIRIVQEAGSKSFIGFQKDFADIREGRIDGDRIEWKVDCFTVEGKIAAEGKRLLGLQIRSSSDSDFLATYNGERGEAPGQGTCAVCISDFEVGEELRTLPCAHKFHTACVEQWLALADHCPVCRCSVSASAARA
eukprot:TRINITY_DN21353_c0_g1_i2.p1 TRINITY_DN21353_c0_g1~~TRINITY_DN21353_c0_g1_i2.p1  ORF type:complete len:532 (-),score=82.49 TRINITY_DN21353_c0_g1_i2:414-2009(-)